MCGRFVVAGEHRDLLGLFEIEIEGNDLPEPSWNVRPTDRVPIVVESLADGGMPTRRLEGARWSLVPSFSDSLKLPYPTFNARSETVAEKRVFAPSVVSRRAILPASGYYEWKTVGTVKTPHYISDPTGPLAFAGLYSWWRDRSRADDDPARWVLTATILTTAATGALADIHDRTPVVLDRELWDDWLDPTIVGDQPFVDGVVAASADALDELEIRRIAPLGSGNDPSLINPL
ncbi:SOS response-associated peptidase [Marisediminicola sp. LYQ134]|uniref:SOS response-associated peptidase n=1 Tax=Marisediminicola sp. LYQ134 TaxID=3391061 RepID=UPI0039837990